MNSKRFVNEKSELIEEKTTQRNYFQGDKVKLNEKTYIVVDTSDNIVNLKESSQVLFS